MKRFADWDVRLMEYATGAKGEPFEWGRTNCAALAAGCVDAMTGGEFFQAQADLDLDESKARELSDQGFTLAMILEAGLVQVQDAAHIQRGDIILVHADGWECCHVCLGKYVLTSTPARGVFLARTSDVIKHATNPEVFRCPH